MNAVELLSLSNPRPTLLVDLFPALFPAIPSQLSKELEQRFPRLPSMVLGVCELAATVCSLFSAVTFLNPRVQEDALRKGCPVLTCVTLGEHHMIIGYMTETILALLHCGFFLMAMVHYGKRKAPGWVTRLER